MYIFSIDIHHSLNTCYVEVNIQYSNLKIKENVTINKNSLQDVMISKMSYNPFSFNMTHPEEH